MRDDDSMDYDVAAGVIDTFYDGVFDPREVVAKMNDASEVHVPGHIVSAKEAKRQKRQAQVGAASNVVGLTAGGAALMAAGKDTRLDNAGPVGRWIQKPYKLVRATKVGGKWADFAARPKVAGTLALGAVGLQAANTGGDIVANRVLFRESRKKIEDKLNVKKSLEPVIEARANRELTTDEAIEVVAKGLKEMLHPVKAARAARQARAFETYEPNLIRNALPHVNRKILLTGMGTAGVLGFGTGALVGRGRERKRVRRIAGTDFVSKSLTWTGEIAKVDADKRQVFGWCSLSEIDGEPVVDLQGDYAPIEEIEKSAYEYVVSSRKGGDMHARDGDQPRHVANLVESFVVTPEKLEQMGLPSDSLPLGWWVGFKVDDDETWAKVKSGERTGFSIHGRGVRKNSVV